MKKFCKVTAFLTAQQVSEYRKLHKQIKIPRQADRIKAILLIDKGYGYEQIAEILLMDADSIRRWYKDYEAGGITQLLSDNYAGGEPKLSMEWQQELSEYLEKHVCLTSKEVCHHVQEQYGVNYTEKGMTCLLHRMGFSYKKPKHLPGKADRQKQEAFIREYEALKQCKQAEDKIYFMDGTHPLHNSQMGYGWIKKGKERFIKSNTGRERVNINGAYDIENHRAIVREDQSINAQSTVALLEQMLGEQPLGVLYIILDNARYYRSKEVRDFLSKQPRIQFMFLPPYSPNLNLIERLWKFVKKKVAYNQYYEKFSVFREAFMDFFQKLADHRKELETLMTEKFQLFPV